MYYIFGKKDGFSSVGKLLNFIANSNIPRKLGLVRCYDSLGNPMLHLKYICFLDPNSLHKDLVVERSASNGKVLVKRYLQVENKYNPLNKQKPIDVICDPPIELCKLKIT